MRSILFSILALPFLCYSQNPLEEIVNNNDDLKKLVEDRDAHQIQIIYTRIDRDRNNRPRFHTYYYGVDNELYYYPASTVKMPAAFLALEKLNKLNVIGLTSDSPLKIDKSRPPQVAVAVDSTGSDLKASIAQYVKKIFLVSDNDAYNRLYEFLGQKSFNESLHQKGYRDTRIYHRLGPEGFPFSFEDNQYTNPFSFYSDGKMIYHQGEVHSKTANKLLLRDELRGKAYIDKSDQVVQEPFDFSVKNYFSLQDMHDVLKAVVFPNQTPPHRRFDIADDDYQLLYEWMSKSPKNSGIPAYEKKADNYVKFFIYGDQEDAVIPESIKIFNKVGWAYGFLTDVSYIIDTKNNVEFFLAATIHVNDNDTYNDGIYEYETTGLSFFGNLGRDVYEMEKNRKKKFMPNFSRLGY